eukprot:TRINITY_DN65270_c0_g2_i1.p1 TRINITY_DN65270_c0_g2~~TRINITY_DN65270_c0_g2_i1.p1  ORF type:complete len:174 (+),score=2.79 TRINITY_DN65270_c0_g2_i1:122-643(+)
MTSNCMLFCLSVATQLDWLPNSTFDVVVGVGALYHLWSREDRNVAHLTAYCGTINKLLHLLKPGGVLVSAFSFDDIRAKDTVWCQDMFGRLGLWEDTNQLQFKIWSTYDFVGRKGGENYFSPNSTFVRRAHQNINASHSAVWCRPPCPNPPWQGCPSDQDLQRCLASKGTKQG